MSTTNRAKARTSVCECQQHVARLKCTYHNDTRVAPFFADATPLETDPKTGDEAESEDRGEPVKPEDLPDDGPIVRQTVEWGQLSDCGKGSEEKTKSDASDSTHISWARGGGRVYARQIDVKAPAPACVAGVGEGTANQWPHYRC
jgi:hypothetical protein